MAATLTLDEATTVTRREDDLVTIWQALAADGFPADLLAVCIETAVARDPRLGAHMDRCDRAGCGLLVVDTRPAADHSPLYCSPACTDADAEAADERRTRAGWSA